MRAVIPSLRDLTFEPGSVVAEAIAADKRLQGPYDHKGCKYSCCPVVMLLEDTRAPKLDLDGKTSRYGSLHDDVRVLPAFEPMALWGTFERGGGSIAGFTWRGETFYRVGPFTQGYLGATSTKADWYEVRGDWLLEIDPGCARGTVVPRSAAETGFLG